MTNWVMVPVPEELAAEVHRYLLLNQMRSNAGWTLDLVDKHLRGLQDDARALACAVARRVATGTTPDDAELAAQFGLSLREVFACAQELNEVAVEPNPGLFIYALRDPRAERRLFHMDESCASLVCDWADKHTAPATPNEANASGDAHPGGTLS
jgi:hypothetical protein